MNDAWSQVEPIVRTSIEELELARQESKKSILIYGSLIAGILIFLAVCAGFAITFFMIAIPAIIGYGIVYLVARSEHNRKYKKEVVPKLVQAICPGATYSPEGTFDKEIIKASRLYDVSWGEMYKNEDTIRGKIDKTDFVYGEVKLSHMQSSGKSSVEVIDFRGFVFEADFNKHFPGTTVVTSQRFSLTGDCRGLFSDMSSCHLEDVAFEELYHTYTTNDQEARYILSPALQHRIIEMHRQFRTQLGDDDLSISFHHGRMLIMVPSNTDRFEIKYDLEGVKKDFLAFALMVDIVNQMNLNLRIWTKE